MRKRFINLKDIDSLHNEVHRRCYQTPYLIEFVTTTPSASTLEAGVLVYYTGDNKLYIKDEDGTVRASEAFS